MRSFVALSLACVAAAAPSLSSAPLHEAAADRVIPNSYIIKFKKGVDAASAADHHTWVQQVHGSREEDRHLELRKRGQTPLVDEFFRGLGHTFKISDFLGYSGHFDGATIEQIRKKPEVRRQSD